MACSNWPERNQDPESQRYHVENSAVCSKGDTKRGASSCSGYLFMALDSDGGPKYGSAMWCGPARELRRGEAVEVEAEEGVGIGIEADLGVGRTGVGASKTFVVDANVHGLDGAEAGIHEEGDGHGVEQGWCFLAPLVVEESEGVGERCALAEEEGALDLVELQLGGVEGHDIEGHSRGEEFLGGRNVIQDVPFRLRGLGRSKAELAVPALDGAAHDDDALELSEGGGIFVDGGAHVHQRADGD